MDRALLNDFYQDIRNYLRTKHTWRGGTVSFRPEKIDSDVVILQRVFSNAMKLSAENESAKIILESFEKYLIDNIAAKGTPNTREYYISTERTDLSDDNIITLCKFNKEFIKELKKQQAKDYYNKEFSFEAGM